jgi:aldose 1-epimerase
MSQQVFWNLDGFAANSSLKVTGHHLHLPFSGLRIDLDEKGVPTGDIKANKQSSAYDFWSSGKSIGRGLNQMRGSASAMGDVPQVQSSGYDETFLISRSQPWKRGDHPVARLSSTHSGISVELYTDQEALHVHTWNEGQGRFAARLFFHHYFLLIFS